MHALRNSFIVLATCLSFVGCQHVARTNTPITLDHPSDQRQQFSLQGKIGVKTPQQTGSAFYTWIQDHDQFDIELTGILGMGKTIIEGRPGEVSLNSAKTGLITAETPEELLERATGWVAPITHIVSWVQGRPATSQAVTALDDGGRIVQLDEDGWNVQLSYNDDAKLPNKMILKQALEDGKENRITMVIQNR